MFNPRVSALEYAVIFLLEQEEKRLIHDAMHDSDHFRTLAQLEDLRAELQSNMEKKDVESI